MIGLQNERAGGRRLPPPTCLLAGGKSDYPMTGQRGARAKVTKTLSPRERPLTVMLRRSTSAMRARRMPIRSALLSARSGVHQRP